MRQSNKKLSAKINQKSKEISKKNKGEGQLGSNMLFVLYCCWGSAPYYYLFIFWLAFSIYIYFYLSVFVTFKVWCVSGKNSLNLFIRFELIWWNMIKFMVCLFVFWMQVCLFCFFMKPLNHHNVALEAKRWVSATWASTPVVLLDTSWFCALNLWSDPFWAPIFQSTLIVGMKQGSLFWWYSFCQGNAEKIT